MLASRKPKLFNGNMETRPASASNSASRARNGAAQASESADWRPADGIIGRMLAYRDWWNIPDGRARGASGRGRGRAQARPDREENA
jgi:hypothetical protein